MEKKNFRLSDYNEIINDWSVYKMSFPKMIIAKCYDCCCYDKKEVKLCLSKSCPLWIYKDYYYNKNKRRKTSDEVQE